MSILFSSPLPRPPRKVRPGVAHIPGFLSVEQQHDVVELARTIARETAGTSAAMRRVPVGHSGGMTSAYLMTLGQAYLSQPFRYVPRDTGGVEAPAVPQAWQELARRAMSTATKLSEELKPGENDYRADVALVNYYPPEASMGLHIDAMERSSAPVISFSIGDEALFRMGNTQGRTKPWDDLTLMSGDLLVFGGPARWAYHGVPKIHPNTAPPGCGLEQGRINLTIRQVEV